MAGRIPRAFIDDLLNRVDIVQLIDSRVPLKKKGREYWACCPFHNENSPSFSVSAQKQFYHCFGCQENGNAIGFLMSYEHLEFVEAIEVLAHELGLEIPYETPTKPHNPQQKEQREHLLDTLRQCDQYYQHN